MKILFLNYEYPPLGGGAGVATEALLKEWAGSSANTTSEEPSMNGKVSDIEVHLVTAAVGTALEHIRVGKNVYIHRIPIGKNPKKLHSQSLRDIFVYTVKGWFFLQMFLRHEKKKQPFDVTLAFFTVPCGFIAYLLKLFYGIPYVVSLRGADVPGFSEKYDTLYFFLKPLVRFLWKRAEKVIPNSIGIRDLALRTSPKQSMTIIENGVDTVSFVSKDGERSFDPIIFLSTSRLTLRKGIHHLVEAFAVAVQHATVPMELHLIGEGEQKEMLEARVAILGIADQVKFLGRVERYLLPQFYQKAHVFVLPSKNEGMSNAALEALASGLPLIVSGTGGMQELVTDGVNGFFVDPELTAPFAETLVSLAQHRESIIAFGAESRHRAEERGWDKVAGRFHDILEYGIKK
ncbi:MAG: glycosyltransferase family 4 protein [Candidatus Moranbacteria bacterium]|nr:glycosyltransferase family 4 protein [Candidatus Moranbacteria bacterium]